MSNHPAITPTFTKFDESWSVENTLVIFDSLQILLNSDNVLKIMTSQKLTIFASDTNKLEFQFDLSTLYLYRMRY